MWPSEVKGVLENDGSPHRDMYRIMNLANKRPTSKTCYSALMWTIAYGLCKTRIRNMYKETVQL